MSTHAREQAAAFHEAGHAALHVYLDVPFRWVSIVPDDTAGTAGGVMGGRMPKYVRDWHDEGGLTLYTPVPLRVRDWIERETMILLAGELAQEQATGTTEGSAATSDHPEHGTVIIDGDWHQIIELVDSLSIGDGDRSAYLEWLRERTIAILGLDEVWATVEAIAAALAEDRHLTARKVER